MKKNIKIIVEYDGTDYSGWQRQKNGPSIQEELEGGLFKLTGETRVVYGAGRTDSGVHARGQTAHFFTQSNIPAERFAPAFNRILPADIRLRDSTEVSLDFDSRTRALARHYRYSMIIGHRGIAIGRNYYYRIPAGLDIESMEKAGRFFVGTHDFKAFQASGGKSQTTARTIYSLDLTFHDPYLYLDIIGDGFLYNMVRIIAGTLIYVGKGKISPEQIPDIIEARDRRLAGPTAPAHGLCLEKVYYNEDDYPFERF